MRLSIIIVNYNTRRLLADCLRSLFDDPAASDWEIIVVDNASSDDSVAMVQRDFPAVKLIAEQTNLGFSRANNHGAQISGGHHLLFLNSDTLVPPGAISQLSQFLTNTQDAAIVGPRLVSPDGSIQHSAQNFPSPWSMFCSYFLLNRIFPHSPFFGGQILDSRDHSHVHRVDYIAGACLLIRRDCFDAIGGWCTDYFFYAEDADICARARAGCEKSSHCGNTYFFAPCAITHIGGASSSQAKLASTIEAHRSIFLFMHRHRGPGSCFATRLVMLSGVIPRALLTILALPFGVIFGKGRLCWNALRRYGRVIGLALSRNIFPTGSFAR